MLSAGYGVAGQKRPARAAAPAPTAELRLRRSSLHGALVLIAVPMFRFGRDGAAAPPVGAEKRVPDYTEFGQKTALQKPPKSRILATQF